MNFDEFMTLCKERNLQVTERQARALFVSSDATKDGIIELSRCCRGWIASGVWPFMYQPSLTVGKAPATVPRTVVTTFSGGSSFYLLFLRKQS